MSSRTRLSSRSSRRSPRCTSSATGSRSRTCRPTSGCTRKRSTSGSRRRDSTSSRATTARCRSDTARSSVSVRTPRRSWSPITGGTWCPTIPVSMALCFVVGALIGFPALRVKGLYLALVTLGLAVVFPDLTDRFVNGTGGTNLVTLKGADVAVPDWFFWFPDPIAKFLDKWVGAPDQWAYYLTLVIGLLLLLAVFFMVARPVRARAHRGARPRGRGRDRRHQSRAGEGHCLRAERAVRRHRGLAVGARDPARERRQGGDVPAVDRVPGRRRDRRRGDGHRPDARRIHRRAVAGSDRQHQSPERPVLRSEPCEAALAGDLRNRPDHLDVRPTRWDRRRCATRGSGASPAGNHRRPRRWRPDERNLHATPTTEARHAGHVRRGPGARARRLWERTRRRRRQRQRQQHDHRRRRFRQLRHRHRELPHRPEQRRDHRRHDQVRDLAPAVGDLLRVLVDPEGRTGVLRVPQHGEGWCRDRGQEVQDRARSPRTTRTTAESTFANVQSLVDDDKVFGLFNVVGTKNNLAIRDYVNERLHTEPADGHGSPAWGNHELPVDARPFLVPYPLEIAGVRAVPRGQQAQRHDRAPARRRRLRCSVLRHVEAAHQGHASSRSP